MSTLVVDELNPGVQFDQKVKIARDINVSHIRPWVYIQSPLVDGDFKLTVLQGATELATSIINYVDINAAMTEAYFHGYLRFDFDSLFLGVAQGNTEEEYTFRFEMINSNFNSTFFLAVCRIWDIRFYDIYGTGVVAGEPPNDMVEPAGLEIYEYKK